MSEAAAPGGGSGNNSDKPDQMPQSVSTIQRGAAVFSRSGAENPGSAWLGGRRAGGGINILVSIIQPGIGGN